MKIACVDGWKGAGLHQCVVAQCLASWITVGWKTMNKGKR